MPNLEEQVQYEIDHFDKSGMLKALNYNRKRWEKKYGNANPPVKNPFDPQVYMRKLNDPGYIRAYCQAKVLHTKTEKAISMLQDYRLRYLNGGKSNSPTGTERAIMNYLDTSGTEQAEKYNKELLDRYFSPERGKIHEAIVKDALAIDTQGLIQKFDPANPVATMDLCFQNQKDVALGFVYKDLIKENSPDLSFTQKFLDMSSKTEIFIQSPGTYSGVSDMMASPLGFCMEDMNELTNNPGIIEKISEFYTSADKDDFLGSKRGCQGANFIYYDLPEFKRAQQFFRDNPDINFQGTSFLYKAVNANNEEIPLHKVVMQGKPGRLVYRTPEELQNVTNFGQPITGDPQIKKDEISYSHTYEDVKQYHNNILRVLREDEGKPMRGDPTRQMLREFRELANIHFARPKPAGFFFLIRTPMARAHAAERKLMNEYVRLLSERGVSKETLDTISDRAHAGETLTDEQLKAERRNVAEIEKARYGVELDLPENSKDPEEPVVTDTDFTAGVQKDVSEWLPGENLLVNESIVPQNQKNGPQQENNSIEKPQDPIVPINE